MILFTIKKSKDESEYVFKKGCAKKKADSIQHYEPFLIRVHPRIEKTLIIFMNKAIKIVIDYLLV